MIHLRKNELYVIRDCESIREESVTFYENYSKRQLDPYGTIVRYDNETDNHNAWINSINNRIDYYCDRWNMNYIALHGIGECC